MLEKQCAVGSVKCAICYVQFALSNVQCEVRNAMQIMQCILGVCSMCKDIQRKGWFINRVLRVHSPLLFPSMRLFKTKVRFLLTTKLLLYRCTYMMDFPSPKTDPVSCKGGGIITGSVGTLTLV